MTITITRDGRTGKGTMASSLPTRFTLTTGGQDYAVESGSTGLHTVARLFVAGQQVDEQKGMDKTIHLTGGALTVVVGLNWLGGVTEILAVPRGTDPRKADAEGIAFTPPPGSHAARMDELRRRQPLLYAARHVVIAVAQVVFGFLGIGALIWALVEGLLPRIILLLPDLPAIPWPAIPWPSLPLPAIDLPDLSHLAWIKDLWNSVNWLVPIIIAIIVALNEVNKRRKRERG